MNKLLCRVLPALMLAVLVACAPNTQPVNTEPVNASFRGVWNPRTDIAELFRNERGGILSADFRGETVEIRWATPRNQTLTLSRPSVRTVGAGWEEWASAPGALTVDDGTPVTLTLKCPIPSVNSSGRPFMICRNVTQGYRVREYDLLLLRNSGR
jgi:hypothetical protein